MVAPPQHRGSFRRSPRCGSITLAPRCEGHDEQRFFRRRRLRRAKQDPAGSLRLRIPTVEPVGWRLQPTYDLVVKPRDPVFIVRCKRDSDFEPSAEPQRTTREPWSSQRSANAIAAQRAAHNQSRRCNSCPRDGGMRTETADLAPVPQKTFAAKVPRGLSELRDSDL